MKTIIVGAGPAGVTTALLLARCGIEVTLLERETSFERVFRGEGLTPSGVKALYEMGLEAVFERVPNRLLASWNIFIDYEEVFTISEPLEETGKYAFRVMSQPTFLEEVIGFAERYPSFTFERGVNITELKHDGEGRVSGVEVKTAEGLRTFDADLVIACDGRGSLLRKRAGLDLTLLPESYDVLWTKLPAPESLRGTCQFWIMVAGGQHPAFAYTSWDDRLQYGLIAPKGSLGEFRHGDWLSAVVGAAPHGLKTHMLAHRDEAQDPILLNVMVGRAESWSVPGFLLLGDAAHPMSPVRAQGINLAFRDAIVTANHLVPVFRSGAHHADIDLALQRIGAERQPEIERSQALQLQEARGQGDARSASWRFRVGKRGAKLLGGYGWAKRAWLGRQKELRYGVTDVRLSAEAGRASDAPEPSPA